MLTRLVYGKLIFKVVRYRDKFVKDREKSTYTEVWGLAVSEDGDTVFTVRDNAVLISDIGES